jgi:hypothetical protein
MPDHDHDLPRNDSDGRALAAPVDLSPDDTAAINAALARGDYAEVARITSEARARNCACRTNTPGVCACAPHTPTQPVRVDAAFLDALAARTDHEPPTTFRLRPEERAAIIDEVCRLDGETFDGKPARPYYGTKSDWFVAACLPGARRRNRETCALEKARADAAAAEAAAPSPEVRERQALDEMRARLDARSKDLDAREKKLADERADLDDERATWIDVRRYEAAIDSGDRKLAREISARQDARDERARARKGVKPPDKTNKTTKQSRFAHAKGTK